MQTEQLLPMSTIKSIDSRSTTLDDHIIYKNLHVFRLKQIELGLDLTDLTDEQWGLVALDKCHHISITTVTKDGLIPQSYRVRICKTCCQDAGHIELGTYVDQESAMLVNDAHEINSGRFDRLIVLRAEDKPHLHLLTVKRFDRSRGRDSASVLDILAERSQSGSVDGGSATKKRKSFCLSTDTDLLSLTSSIHFNKEVPSSPSSSVFSEDTTNDSSANESLVNCVTSFTQSEQNQVNVAVDESEDNSETKSEVVVKTESSASNLDKSSSSSSNLFECLAPLIGVAFSATPSSPPKHNTRRSGLRDSSEDTTMANLLLLKSMPDTNLSPIVAKRQRSSTFSAPSFGNKRDKYSDCVPKTPMAALTWLASLEDDEVDVAQSLFNLSLPNSAAKSYMDDSHVDYGYDMGYGDGSSLSQSPTNYPYEHYNMELLLPDEEYSHSRVFNGTHKSVAVHSNTVTSRIGGGVSGTGRARSHSMTTLDKSSTSSSSSLVSTVLNTSFTGGLRSKADPLAMALKKFNEKGHNLDGYIGIYSPEDRKERIKRFIDKRKLRMWTKKVKYDVRKNFADSRVRVKGRFVKKGDESASTSPCSPVNATHDRKGTTSTSATQRHQQQQSGGGRMSGDLMQLENTVDDDDEEEDEE